MRLLKFKPFHGPKRFVFTDPDTNFKYWEATERDLIRRIVSYRAQNQLASITQIGMVLQNYWCGLLENQGNCEDCEPLKRGFISYLKGGIALLDNLWYGESARVSQLEADRRAEICIKCPFNIFPDKGPFIAWSDSIAEHSVGDLKAAHHDELGNCEVCTCTLKAKVWYRGNMGLAEEQEVQMRAVGCWQVEDKK